MSSAGSEAMQGAFDDPSIQNGPRQTQKKQSLQFRAGVATGANRLPPTSMPPGPAARTEESKKWKSTRENQNYSKLNAARDSSGARHPSCSARQTWWRSGRHSSAPPPPGGGNAASRSGSAPRPCSQRTSSVEPAASAAK